jgi:hypothetical protein
MQTFVRVPVARRAPWPAVRPVRFGPAGRARLFALVVTSVVVLVWNGPSGHDAPEAGASPSASPVAAVAEPTAFYVVRSGDTLWDIARRLHPGADPRPIVDALARANGGAALRAGDRLPLPAAVAPR